MSAAPTPVEVVGGLIRVERVRSLAYETAIGRGLAGGDAALARRFARHSRDRAAALRTQLEALGGGLDGLPPLELREDPLEGARGRSDLLRALGQLERVAVDTCARSLARLDVPELIATVASVMGGHAEQLAALRLAVAEEAP